VGLFQAISTYCDEFTITFSACREMLPDPELYAQCLRDSLAALLAASKQQAQQRAASPTPSKPKAPRKVKSATVNATDRTPENAKQ
jgi:diacylglycerol O-acyltransferase